MEHVTGKPHKVSRHMTFDLKKQLHIIISMGTRFGTLGGDQF